MEAKVCLNKEIAHLSMYLSTLYMGTITLIEYIISINNIFI